MYVSACVKHLRNHATKAINMHSLTVPAFISPSICGADVLEER